MFAEAWGMSDDEGDYFGLLSDYDDEAKHNMFSWISPGAPLYGKPSVVDGKKVKLKSWMSHGAAEPKRKKLKSETKDELKSETKAELKSEANAEFKFDASSSSSSSS